MEIISRILEYFDGISYLGYILAFLFAASEATIGISMLTPGSVSVAALGALSAFGAFKIEYILLSAFLGAILGDNIGYFLGSKFGTKFLLKTNIAKQETIDLAYDFIKKHGAKSVFLGRFVPFIKETVPFIAGTLNMHRKTFMLYNTLGAFGWTLFWPGSAYLFAKSFLEGDQFISGIHLTVAALLFLYLFYFFMKDFILQKYDVQRSKVDFFSKINKKRMFLFTSVLIFIYSIFTALSLLVLNEYEFITVVDFVTYKIIYANFSSLLFLFFYYITKSASFEILFLVSILFLICTFYKKRFIAEALSLSVSVFFAGFAVHFLKHIFAIPRPDYALIVETGFSFPSGHAAAISVFIGLLIFYIYKKNVKYKEVISGSLVLWAVLIYLSRLYLGVHYVSDIVGGIILGMFFVVFGIAIYSYTKGEHAPTFLKDAYENNKN